jgi:hypothetical protein
MARCAKICGITWMVITKGFVITTTALAMGFDQ